ncbi:hypothetical protein KIM372_11630 [Bombiscardovia nodaiensis]|uniref:RCC1-like domain-containing protein n=1 Tax=Bombiscardovia nodaiensis TaxID=2932181 RepID=A0ABM8B8P8_9BIFI|nr:hypothetical protein KIM372_11630 [Bombiscardovia nodaiensis]
MRRFRTMSALLALVSITILGGGSTSSLTHPTPAHADETSNHFRLNPTSGPAAGGTQLTITPYTIPGVTFKQVSSQLGHTLAIGSDGNAYAWGGYPSYTGAVCSGVNCYVPSRLPTPAGVKFTQVSAGGTGHHSLALGTDGNVYSWGQNTSGQLGFGDTVARTTPTKMPLPVGVNRFVAVRAGNITSFAISDAGRVYAWGHNGHGELGMWGAYRTIPTLISSVPSKIAQLSVFYDFSAALSTDGILYTWGANVCGQRGLGDTSDHYNATTVPFPAGVRRFTSISAGEQTMSAKADDGKIYMWGRNSEGEFGDGSRTANVLRPMAVAVSMPPGVKIKLQNSGGDFTTVIGTDNNLYTWGNGSFGQLGYNSYVQPTPRQVTPPAGVVFTNVIAGRWNAFATGSDGNTYAWGMNTYSSMGDGYLGDGTNINRNTPVRVGGVINITKVTIGGQVTPGTVDPVSGKWTGTSLPHDPGDVDVVVEWTLNGVAQPSETLKYRYLDTFTVDFKLGGAPGTPPPTQRVLEGSKASWPATPVWAGHRFAGWFEGSRAHSFNEPVTRSFTLTARWEQFAFTLDPKYGSPGGGTDVTISADPKSSVTRFSQVSVGGSHTLALGTDGHVYAWGANASGQLGNGDTTARTAPTVVVGTPPGVSFTQVVAGPDTSFALGSDHHWYAWGANASGQLGTGNTANQTSPVRITMPAGVTAYTQVSPGRDHTLALGDDGVTYAWGANTAGQLGNDSTAGSLTPVKTQTPGGVFQFTALSAGFSHSLAIGDNGLAYAWGSNQYGQLGSLFSSAGGSSAVPIEVQVPLGVSSFSRPTATADWSLAIGDNGRIITWGRNANRQLGTSTTTDRSLPDETNLPAGVTFTGVNTKADGAMAIGSNHRIYAWGDNSSGQLGTGNQTSPTSPIAVDPKPGVAFAQLMTGRTHTIGVDTNGDLYAWGDNSTGQLGDDRGGHPGDRSLTPIALTPVQVNVTAVKMDGLPVQSGPTYDATAGVWHIITRPHAQGSVPVAITWTLSGVPQPDYPLTYFYGNPLSLPAAGAIPLQRLGGSALLALAIITAVTLTGHHLSKARKRKQGQGSPRPNHSNRR